MLDLYGFVGFHQCFLFVSWPAVSAQGAPSETSSQREEAVELEVQVGAASEDESPLEATGAGMESGFQLVPAFLSVLFKGEESKKKKAKRRTHAKSVYFWWVYS